MKLDCTETAQVFIVNDKAERVWEGLTPDGRRLFFVLVATQPTPTTPGVDKVVESLPLPTLVSLAATAGAAVVKAARRPALRAPGGPDAIARAAYTPPRPLQPAPVQPAAPVLPAGEMHPALRMRLQKAVATLKKKRADSYDRQQALNLLKTHRDKLSQIPGAEESVGASKAA